MRLRARRAALVAAFAAAALGACVPAVASARTAYLVDDSARQVDVIDLATGQQVAPPIPTGKDPRELAISADGTRAYVANVEGNTVTAIDTRTNTVIGGPIPVGKGPIHLALTPDGRRLYVENLFSFDISVIDTGSDTVVATLPIEALSMTISADGSLLYIGTDQKQVVTLSTATNLPVGSPIAVGEYPEALALTPDGRKLFVANDHDGTLDAFDVATGAQIGAPLPVGEFPDSLAITPNGQRLYIGRNLDASVAVVDAVDDTVIGGPIPVGNGPYAVAMAPDGRHVYTGTQTGLQSIDTTTGEVSTFKMATVHTGLAIVPNQGPRARLATTLAGTTATLDASGSSDPDGQIASYAWDFGDGTTATTTSPTVTHAYRPGATYQARVTPVDGEGCGATRIGSGQIVYCNPSGEPTATAAVTVPGAAAPAPGRPPTTAPGRRHAVLHLGRLVLHPDSGTATLQVRAAQAGRLSVGGAQIQSRSVHLKRAGVVGLQIIARGAALARLARAGHLTVKVRVVVRSPGLLPSHVSRSIGLIDRAAGPDGD